MNNGKAKNIEKNPDTLQKEKQFRKQYLASLDQENIMKDSRYFHQYNHLDEKKKLYDSTEKVIDRQTQSHKNFNKTLLVYKKPKYDHIYRSKGITPSTHQAQLGPGAYEVKNNAFRSENRL